MRLTPAVLFAAVCLTAAPARATDFSAQSCILTFAITADEASAERLTVSTYWELIDKVAQGKISPATLEKMENAENPFEVPEQQGHDLGGLRSQLKRFEELLGQRSWRTPEVITAIRKSVTERIHLVRGAEATRQSGMAETEADFTVPIPRLDGMTASPDGRWLVSTNRQNTTPADGDWTMNLYDMKERKLTTIPGSNLHLDQPKFSQDGKQLLFPAPGYRLYSVPITEGQPDWASGKYIGRKFEDGRGNSLKVGKDPNFVIAGAHTKYLFLYDLQKGTSVRLDTERFHGNREWGFGGASGDYGIVPGTNDLWLRTNANSGTDRMRVFTVSANGQLTLKETLWERENPPAGHPEEKFERHTFFLPDATPVTSWARNNEPGLNFYVGKSAKVVRLDFPAGRFSPAKVTPNDNLIVHPTKPEVALLYHNEGRSKYFVVHFDLAKGKVMGSYELPGRSQSIRFSPDGERMFAEPWNEPMHALNYRNRLQPE